MVTATCVEKGGTSTAPDDHLASGPDGCVIGSAIGSVVVAGGCPAIRAGIVSPAGVKKLVKDKISSAPNDHFAASPDSRVTAAAIRRVGGAGG
jgi:hypothetical protein